MKDIGQLTAGELGFITAGIKTVGDTKVGDTITDDKRPAAEALPGFKPSVPVVFCSMFPLDTSYYENLRDALGKLQLNDASFEFTPENLRRWARDSGVVFWDFCIWKSLKSVWNANSGLI